MQNIKPIELTTEEITVYDALYKKFYNFVLRTAFNFCQDRGDAEDIAQEAFVVLAQAFREKELMKFERLDVWLMRTVKNQFRKYLRDKTYSPPTAEVELDSLPYETPEDELTVIENLDYLTNEEQKILRYHLYGFPLIEVAEMVGITYDYCRKKHSRIMRRVEHHARMKKLLK